MTPMLKQYLSIKKKVPSAILFFRLGDFYEMFFEDAEKASALLDITLTSRDGGSAGKVPMCGIPYHAAKGYINRLNREGLKVAICEQVEDPRIAKGIVKREVVRIITPGTNLEDEDFFSFQSNYIASCYKHNGVWGLSYLDLSTGMFKLTELGEDEDLLNEISRLNPKEFIIPGELKENSTVADLLRQERSAVVNHYEDWIFDLEESAKRIKEQFQLLSLDGLGLAQHSVGISAAGALLYYLKDNLHHSLDHLKRPLPYYSSEHMVLDRRTQKNLELVDPLTGDKKGITLFTVLNETLTPMGARVLSQWIKQPLLLPRPIMERYDAIDDLIKDQSCLSRVRSQLKHIRDMERLLSRITCGVCSARDLTAIKESLKIIPELKDKVTSKTKKVFLKHIIHIDDIEIPDDPNLSFKEKRRLAKEKGRLVRRVTIDDETLEQVYDFLA